MVCASSPRDRGVDLDRHEPRFTVRPRDVTLPVEVLHEAHVAGAEHLDVAAATADLELEAAAEHDYEAGVRLCVPITEHVRREPQERGSENRVGRPVAVREQLV